MNIQFTFNERQFTFSTELEPLEVFSANIW